MSCVCSIAKSCIICGNVPKTSLRIGVREKWIIGEGSLRRAVLFSAVSRASCLYWVRQKYVECRWTRNICRRDYFRRAITRPTASDNRLLPHR